MRQIALGVLLGATLAVPPAASQAAPWRDQVLLLATATFRHPAWGASHSERDYVLGRALAAQDGLAFDDDVLFAASYLHDMAAFPPFAQEGVDHADRAVALVDSVLGATGFPMPKIERVKDAIRTHMYNRPPASAPEAVLLHDADGLDWLGYVGVARMLALVDPTGKKPGVTEAIASLRGFMTTVPPTIITRAGQAMAAERVAAMQRFLDGLAGETVGGKAY